MGTSLIAENMVMMSFTEWMNYEEEHVRLENYNFFERYYQGEHENALPAEIREAYKNPISPIANFCRPVVDIPVRYIVGKPQDISIDVTAQGVKTPEALQAEAYITQVYKESGLFDDGFLKLLRGMGKKGDAFLKLYLVGSGDAQDVRISVVRPDVVYPYYRSDDYEDMLACAVKWYNRTGVRERRWMAEVYYPPEYDPNGNEITESVVHTYDLGTQGQEVTRQYTEDDSGELKRLFRSPANADKNYMQPQIIDEQPNPFSPYIPIIHLKNNVDDLPFGVSDLHPVTELQDALNILEADLMQVMGTQAFQRMFIMGATGNERYYLGPGMVTNVPNENARLDVVPPVNIGYFLYAIDAQIDLICTVSNTPKFAFAEFAQGIPASGFALQVRYTPLEDKCNEKRAQLRAALRKLNRLILYMSGKLGILDPASVQGLDVDVHFPGGVPKDELMNAQMYSIYQGQGWMSPRTIMEKIGVENIAEEENRIREYMEWLIQAEAKAQSQSNTKE